MPFNKVKVFLWDRINRFLERKAVQNVPDAKQIVHSTGNQPFATRVKLAELHCFGMAYQLANFVNLVLNWSCKYCRWGHIISHLFLGHGSLLVLLRSHWLSSFSGCGSGCSGDRDRGCDCGIRIESDLPDVCFIGTVTADEKSRGFRRDQAVDTVDGVVMVVELSKGIVLLGGQLKDLAVIVLITFAEIALLISLEVIYLSHCSFLILIGLGFKSRHLIIVHVDEIFVVIALLAMVATHGGVFLIGVFLVPAIVLALLVLIGLLIRLLIRLLVWLVVVHLKSRVGLFYSKFSNL